MNWCEEKKVENCLTEQVLLAYFENLSKKYKSSSLWAYYSMIMKKNLDISKYIQLIAFLKRKSDGYKPKKSKVLTRDDVTKFLHEADDEYLLIKVNPKTFSIIM